MPSNGGKNDFQEELSKWLGRAGRLVVAGIGNPIRGDDFVGVKIVQNLKGRVSSRVFLVECETVPESYIEQIVEFNPTHILLIDAAVLGMKPGDYEFREPENLRAAPAFSTHMLPLRIFCEYLLKTTKARIGLLLIEPENTDFGDGLSPVIDTVAEKITRTLLEAFSREN